MKKLLFVLAFCALSVPAFANLVIAPSVGYSSSAVNATVPNSLARDTESSSMVLDMKLGYVLPMGLYLGGMYSHISSESCSGNICSDSSGFLMGPSLGYFSMTGFYTLLTYHIMGESGDTTKFTGGKGPQVDFGWVFPISSYVSIGPQLTWRSVEFDKIENAGLTQTTDIKQTDINPYISLWFMF